MYAGGVPAHHVAKWNGSEWCGIGGDFENNVSALAFCRDTLYVGGGFITIDGDSLNYIAKWIGGNYIDSCGNTASIKGINQVETNITFFPSPSSGNFTLQFPDANNGIAEITIFNILGNSVYSEELKTISGTNKLNININGLPDGIYLLRATIGENFYSAKIIKQ